MSPINPSPKPSPRETPTTAPSTSRAQKNFTTPLVIGGLALALAGFTLGRSTAPENSPSGISTTPAEPGAPTTENSDGEGDNNTAEGSASGTITFEGESAQLAGIQVQAASLSSFASNLPFNGQIALNPNAIVRVASLVPGRLTRLGVAQGDRVRQGQILAVIESRAIGEAQSSYQSALSRFQNARSNLNVVLQQARTGVFARAPIEAARRTLIEAQADVKSQETAVRAARIAFDNALRLARTGSFASPALEAARAQAASAQESLRTAQASLTNANASVQSAQTELARRKELAAGGAYVSRPIEEARRLLIAAQSARGTAQSEVATTRANLSRAKSLVAEGLVSRRDVEAAQQAFDTATARLETTQADEKTTSQELERQQKLATSNVAGVAEVSAAQSALISAQADVRTRAAEVTRAREGVRLASLALAREQAIFKQNIANRREVGAAQANLDNARTALEKARQTLTVAESTFERERRVLGQNLNNIAQVQSAQSSYNAARAELQAARSTLALFKSSPGGSASVPVRAPISGIVQARDVAQGETIEADKQLITLVNLNQVAIEAAIYEKDFARVRIGAPVTATVDAFPGRQFGGTVTFISSQLDPETRTLTARALLSNPGALRPGMFARGQISTKNSRLVVVVPSDAVQTMEGKSVVFVATEKTNEFKTLEVQTGQRAGGLTEIQRGLRPGQKVVSKGAFVVKSQAMKDELAEE